jgi:Dyp-type peroxidase family
MTPDPALEPRLDWDDIQGNILGGFNKDHQTLIGLNFGADVGQNKKFLCDLAKRITPLKAVVSYKSTRAQLLLDLGKEPRNLKAVWMAAAFSFDALRSLTSDADSFTDLEFRQGLPKSSARLGDPTSKDGMNDFSEWVIGAPGHIPDVLIIVAADEVAELAETVTSINRSASSFGLENIYEETGHDLSHYSDEDHTFPSGHEHFGFKDGVSQPGIRGALPNGRFLTERTVKANDPDDSSPEYAEVGKPLVCAGQFVLGYAQQIDTAPRQAGPPRPLGSQPNPIAPSWAANGSFLVFRRLRQDVAGFYAFVNDNVAAIGRADLSPERLAAMLVGRWPSGAAVIRTPLQDDPKQATRSLINAFAYGGDNISLNLPADSQGVICPIAGHVRKVNPRDGDTNIGFASATLTVRILRRGIPYGRPFDPKVPESPPVDRGLLFLSYQASIAQQFEFLSTNWMNNALLPRNPSGHTEGLGFDMLVGQQFFGRGRSAYLRFAPDGTQDVSVTNQNSLVKDWVIPTGGGYFFAPSISTIANVLGG